MAPGTAVCTPVENMQVELEMVECGNWARVLVVVRSVGRMEDPICGVSVPVVAADRLEALAWARDRMVVDSTVLVEAVDTMAASGTALAEAVDTMAASGTALVEAVDTMAASDIALVAADIQKYYVVSVRARAAQKEAVLGA